MSNSPPPATPNPERCPTCQSEIMTQNEKPYCPVCLLKQGMASSTFGGFPDLQTWQPPAVGELAGKFPHLEVESLIGKGGMGAVYRVQQKELGRIAALKVLPDSVCSNAGFRERFLREARLLASLSHPHIVTVYEFGQSEGVYFLLMEFVDGVTLRQASVAETTQRIAPKEALAIVEQLCDALQFAHDEGVVHRDIKPENILLDKRGRVKIADFGLARLLGKPADFPTLTRTNQLLGTPVYMAPEQMEGRANVDHRADLYSLGVVFYELLTGELPLGRFQAPSKKSDVDARLDEVVFRTLEKEPERRYQQASEIRTDMRAVNHPPETPQPPRKLSSTAIAALLGILAGVAICMVAISVPEWIEAANNRAKTESVVVDSIDVAFPSNQILDHSPEGGSGVNQFSFVVPEGGSGIHAGDFAQPFYDTPESSAPLRNMAREWDSGREPLKSKSDMLVSERIQPPSSQTENSDDPAQRVLQWKARKHDPSQSSPIAFERPTLTRQFCVEAKIESSVQADINEIVSDIYARYRTIEEKNLYFHPGLAGNLTVTIQLPKGTSDQFRGELWKRIDAVAPVELQAMLRKTLPISNYYVAETGLHRGLIGWCLLDEGETTATIKFEREGQWFSWQIEQKTPSGAGGLTFDKQTKPRLPNAIRRYYHEPAPWMAVHNVRAACANPNHDAWTRIAPQFTATGRFDLTLATWLSLKQHRHLPGTANAEFAFWNSKYPNVYAGSANAQSSDVKKYRSWFSDELPIGHNDLRPLEVIGQLANKTSDTERRKLLRANMSAIAHRRIKWRMTYHVELLRKSAATDRPVPAGAKFFTEHGPHGPALVSNVIVDGMTATGELPQQSSPPIQLEFRFENDRWLIEHILTPGLSTLNSQPFAVVAVASHDLPAGSSLEQGGESSDPDKGKNGFSTPFPTAPGHAVVNPRFHWDVRPVADTGTDAVTNHFDLGDMILCHAVKAGDILTLSHFEPSSPKNDGAPDEAAGVMRGSTPKKSPPPKLDKEGDATRIRFEDLDLGSIPALTEKTAALADAIPEWIRELSGKTVRIRGFMYPTFKAENITTFVLTRDKDICCFGPNPKVHHRIHVVLAAAETANYMEQPFDFQGVFKVDAQFDSGELFQIFHLEDAKRLP